MAIANMVVNLRADISNFASKLTDAAARMQSFGTNTKNHYSAATKELTAHNLGLKDTARIVQGIMISQAFYTAVNAITEATRAIWDFNVALDYMSVTYSALFGDVGIASDFMKELQELSIETIFDYQTLADASKKLLAYGIEYENLMYIMEGLTNLGTMSGDSAALDRISLALGQIYTKGKLSAEEMRQLANAYIPITEILQDKFGLTGDDLKRVGDLNLPASEVINAIVDYANENFGAVGDAAMYTITGLQNKIVDSLKVMGVEMLGPITTVYKSFLAYIADGLGVLREEFAAGGIGGVFEYLVPDKNTQQVIRQFLANVKNLFMSIMSAGVVAGQVFSSFASLLVTAFNIVAPVITLVVNSLASVLNAFLETKAGATTLKTALLVAAGAFVLLKVHALASLVIVAVTNAVTGLSKALALLSSILTNPILALIALLAVSLVGVSVASNNASKSVNGMFDKIAGHNGVASGDVLQKIEGGIKNSAGAADQFSQRLDDATDSADKLKDAISGTGAAAKKTGGLMSFDEVYKLPDPASGGGGGGGLVDSLGELSDVLSDLDLGNLNIDDLIPDIPDFTEFGKGFVDGLFGSIDDSIKELIAGTSIGSLIGGLIGAIIGGLRGGLSGAKAGAKIGAAVGGFGGLLFAALDGSVNNTAAGGIAGILATIGKYLAKSGATGLVSLIKNAFAQGGFKGVWAALAKVIKGTGLKSLLKGGLLGAAIGIVADGIAHLLWNHLEEHIEGADADKAKIGQTIGSIIGSIVGTFFGPAGTIIGSVLGTFAGGFIGLFWERIKEAFSSVPTGVITAIATALGGIPGLIIGSLFTSKYSEEINAWWEDAIGGIGTLLSDTWNSLSTWFVDTAVGFATWASTTWNTVSTWVSDTWEDLSTWWNDTTSGFSTWWDDTFSGLSTWWDDTVALFSDWDSINSETLGDWLSETFEGLSTWWEDTTGGFSTWWEDTTGGFSTWWEDTTGGFSTWWEETKQGFVEWNVSTALTIAQWALSAAIPIGQWASEGIQKIKQWAFDTAYSIGKWAVDTAYSIGKWAVDTAIDIGEWWEETKQGFVDWNVKVIQVLGGFAIAAHKAISTGIGNMLSGIVTGLAQIKQEWDTKWEAIKTSFGNWWVLLRTSMNSWLENNVWKPIADFFNLNTFWQRISTLLDAIKRKVSTWWDGIKGLFTSGNVNVSVDGPSSRNASFAGHATGGIFDREHIARFAEGNKAEAVIPLENSRAMQPFVDAISNGITGTLAPILAGNNANSSNMLPPLYVGTLIADDRGLKQLYKKFEVIQLQENARKGVGVHA